MTTMLPTMPVIPPVLSDELLKGFAVRAPAYDRENRFFSEDFEELRASGYLKLAIPQELGGAGYTLAEVACEQRRLAYRAPATALAINMHLYWTGVAADLYRAGDDSLEWLLKEAAGGAIFAAGHGEAGNDLPLMYSSARAERVEGGYHFTGHKIFGSLSPVWTWLGLHAMDTSDPEHPKVVHAFIRRDTAGYHIAETWDVMGMRATRSDDTVLRDVFVPDSQVVRVLPADWAGADAFVLNIFAWALLNFAHIYAGCAERAFDLTVQSVTKKTSVAMGGATMAHNPMVQHLVAEMALELETLLPHLERITDDWSSGVNHGSLWPSKIVAAKYRAVQGARRVLNLGLDVMGGSGAFRGTEFERLYRDVAMGGIHPANDALTHEIVGKTHLGLLGASPRWG
ncbi:acyl-CoA dehydrogenase family protein [Deinococcus sp. QL22]|uniref:acyl-CoA dehydrogenase family protein n=1 Tax=Deinococcus sp. QL22 TaxID=2939437 RepID=UPI002017373F|nr:acyl-CoA dehydrogenase family protein [Deinococcus sp. QL22]UQN08492.1 acyl-CoA/acyl-ACP dehydrogenase [Deinococcus sp. QL22]